MMRLFVRLLFSLEKLVKNPVNWFSDQHWVFRVLLPLLVIPIISVISITSYQALSYHHSNDDNSVCTQNSQEIQSLKEEITRLNNSQIEELSHMSEDLAHIKQQLLKDADINAAEELSNIDEEEITDNLRQRLQTATDPNENY